jgi:addiction module HigA family antidote
MIPSNRPPTPPGVIVEEEFLKPLGLSRAEAARRMGIPVSRLNEVIRGRRAVKADTALRFARVFNTSPEFWMNLQVACDLYEASRELEPERA